MELLDIRTKHQGHVSEAEKIASEEPAADMFKRIQELKSEKNRKIRQAIEELNREYDVKISEVESQYGLLLTLSSGD